MTDLSQDMERPLPRRERMVELELDRRPRLGVGRHDYHHRRRSSEANMRIGPLRVLRNPGGAELERELKERAAEANARGRLRLVPALSADPVLAYPHGLMEDNGHWPTPGGPYWPYISFVGVAWITLAGVKLVRVWGYRCRGYGGSLYRHLFVPDRTDREGMRCCWALVFPHRFRRFRERREARLRRVLERIGPPGEDDRVNLNLHFAQLRAHVPGLGVILSDHRARTELAQVVVRDPSTGFRHHLSVPPRFGNPRTKTFQELRTAEARIHAAVAWTFGMRPEDYRPALEA